MENCLKPKVIRVTPKHKRTRYAKYSPEGYYQKVPCGVCPLCLNSKRMNWLMRIEQEYKYNDLRSYFLTLTYDEKHVPRKKGVRTLYKRHPQLFLKRVRKAGYKCKYIIVGEYGSKTSRPHYHAIFWTDAPQEQLEKSWYYGNIHIKKVGRGSILYTLKYIIQPKEGDNQVKQKTFALFSKGLGLAYMTSKMYYWHNPENNEPKFYCIIGGRKVPLPRYYKGKIFTPGQCRDNASRVYWDNIRARRQVLRDVRKQGHPDAVRLLRERMLQVAHSVKTKVNYNQML